MATKKTSKKATKKKARETKRKAATKAKRSTARKARSSRAAPRAAPKAAATSDSLTRGSPEAGPKTPNQKFILDACSKTPARPRPYSMWSHSPDTTVVSDYVSWPSLTDRTFTGRHLPPASRAYCDSLPADQPYVSPNENGQVTALFKRTKEIRAERSSLLFPLFGQWFTDSFIRTDPRDKRRNSSNHHIDMCQIYGLRESTTRMLRTLEGGKLKTQAIDGRDFPPALFDVDGHVESEFQDLPYVADGRYKEIIGKFPDRKRHYFATGLERGNSTPGYTALSTLFLREHNRICGELAQRNPSWDDERLFQTARMIVIVLLMKIVIEEYVQHISGAPPNFVRLDHTFAEDQVWYRTNWITMEFDLLYRWHSAIPDRVTIGEVEYGPNQFLLNNQLLIDRGVAGILHDASTQYSCQVGLFNTPDFLLQTEYVALEMARNYKLASFADYRKQFRLGPIEEFEELSDSPSVRSRLGALYGSVDKVEFLVGLYAESPKPRPPFPKMPLFGELLTTMLAVDAFSQAFTNPLLARVQGNDDGTLSGVFKPETFTQYGWDLIDRTSTLMDLAKRNVAHPGTVSMDFGEGKRRTAR